MISLSDSLPPIIKFPNDIILSVKQQKVDQKWSKPILCVDKPTPLDLLSPLKLNMNDAIIEVGIFKEKYVTVKGNLEICVLKIPAQVKFEKRSATFNSTGSNINLWLLGLNFRDVNLGGSYKENKTDLSTSMTVSVGEKSNLNPDPLTGKLAVKITSEKPKPKLSITFEKGSLTLNQLCIAAVPPAEIKENESIFTKIKQICDDIFYIGRIKDEKFKQAIKKYNEIESQELSEDLSFAIASYTDVDVSGEVCILNLLHAFCIIKVDIMEGIKFFAACKRVNLFDLLIIEKSRNPTKGRLDQLNLDGP